MSVILTFVVPASKNMAGKSREELALEKQLELERRLMDVSGQLNSGKKPPKTKRKASLLTVHCSVITGRAAALGSWWRHKVTVRRFGFLLL